MKLILKTIKDIWNYSIRKVNISILIVMTNILNNLLIKKNILIWNDSKLYENLFGIILFCNLASD